VAVGTILSMGRDTASRYLARRSSARHLMTSRRQGQTHSRGPVRRRTPPPAALPAPAAAPCARRTEGDRTSHARSSGPRAALRPPACALGTEQRSAGCADRCLRAVLVDFRQMGERGARRSLQVIEESPVPEAPAQQRLAPSGRAPKASASVLTTISGRKVAMRRPSSSLSRSLRCAQEVSPPASARAPRDSGTERPGSTPTGLHLDPEGKRRPGARARPHRRVPGGSAPASAAARIFRCASRGSLASRAYRRPDERRGRQTKSSDQGPYRPPLRFAATGRSGGRSNPRCRSPGRAGASLRETACA